MKLAFKRYGSGYSEKEVPVIFNILTLKMVCKEFGVDFKGIDEIRKKEPYEFMVELLYQGYISACKESYKKPKYGKEKAILWYEKMSQTTQDELVKLMSDFLSEWHDEEPDKKKVKTVLHGENLTDLQLVS
jgi:hypothetical protein